MLTLDPLAGDRTGRIHHLRISDFLLADNCKEDAKALFEDEPPTTGVAPWPVDGPSYGLVRVAVVD